MLNFHKPSIADYGWIHDITYPANLPGVDMSFHNMYFWECYYGEVAQAAGFVTQRLSKDGVSTYLYPAGAGDVKPALEEILKLKDDSMHIILTGRVLPEGLRKYADSVTTLTTELLHCDKQ